MAFCASNIATDKDKMDNLFKTKPSFHFLENLVFNALVEEAALTPKPGLVDSANNGAHSDMNIFSFYHSAYAISPFVPKFADLGYENNGYSPQALLRSIRPLGIACETAMFKATNDVNTHKGAIFAFGLLGSAMGWLLGNRQTITVEALCQTVALMCEGIVENELNNGQALHTAGYKIYQQYGYAGARGEAQSGFSTIQGKLPLYTKFIEQDYSKKTAMLQILLHFMAENNDTNVISRGGIEGLKFVKQRAKKCLDKGGALTRSGIVEMKNMDNELIALNISPGGSADLIALTHFLYDLQQVGVQNECS